MATTSQALAKQLALTRTIAHGLPERWRVGARDWPLLLKHHPRARRMALRIITQPDTTDSSAIQLTLPPRSSIKAAITFLEASSLWLARELDRQVHPQTIAPGCALPILDEMLTFTHTGQLRGLPARTDLHVAISGAPERFSARVAGYIQQQFSNHAQRVSTEYANVLGVSIRSIRLKEMRARWGSCSSQGDITLHWRLALAPIWVANYVIAHEIAHRRHMNHSAAFWKVVHQLTPDTERARLWLKTHSTQLHAWQF
jgi:predicted metal-dependent hydrolase